MDKWFQRQDNLIRSKPIPEVKNCLNAGPKGRVIFLLAKNNNDNIMMVILLSLITIIISVETNNDSIIIFIYKAPGKILAKRCP